MKYALISEEQIENLKGLTSVLIRLGHPYNAGLCAEILESLKPSEPVAWRVGSMNFHYIDVAKAQAHSKKRLLKPLYALEKSE